MSRSRYIAGSELSEFAAKAEVALPSSADVATSSVQAARALMASAIKTINFPRVLSVRKYRRNKSVLLSLNLFFIRPPQWQIEMSRFLNATVRFSGVQNYSF